MVAKRNISPSLSPAMSKKASQRLRSIEGGKRVVNMYASSHPTPSRSLPLSDSSHNLNGNLNNNLNSKAHPVNPSAEYNNAVNQNIQRNRAKYYRTKAVESVVVIAVNIALSMTAIAAISKLMPYQSSQKDRLDEINMEVKTLEQRVNSLREKLPQTLNSGKSQELLLRNQGWIKHNQITIKLLDPSEVASPNTDGIMPTTTTAQNNPQNNPPTASQTNPQKVNPKPNP